MPYSSMSLSRSGAFHRAASTSDSRRGCAGGYSDHPAIAPPPTALSLLSPKYQASSCCSSSQRTCGTLSPHLATDTRDVQRSAGSMTWVSASTTRNRWLRLVLLAGSVAVVVTRNSSVDGAAAASEN